MRISDWSSDLCSSDLPSQEHGLGWGYCPCPPRPSGLGRGHASRPCPCRHLDLRSGQYALPGEGGPVRVDRREDGRSEEHTSELQSLMRISYAVFCLKKETVSANIALAAGLIFCTLLFHCED